MIHKPRISICTVCMGRLHHLKETLLKNINDNKDYTNLEFILLDYNSNDGLEDFARSECKEYIDKKKLIYYKYQKPRYFDRSHSRNLAFKLATGDIICNVDADNFIGKNFAKYVSSIFNKHLEEIFIVPDENTHSDLMGRVCVSKKNFLEIGGYDEKFKGYGFEDIDLYCRLEHYGVRRLMFSKNQDFFKVLTHETLDRIQNEYGYKNLKFILVNHINFYNSELMFFYKDKTLEKFILTNNIRKSLLNKNNASNQRFNYRLVDHDPNFRGIQFEKDHNIMFWSNSNGMIQIFDNSKNVINIYSKEKRFIYRQNDANNKLYQISDLKLIEELIVKKSLYSNRSISEVKTETNSLIVNGSGFGKGIVYKNFDYTTAITVE